MIERHLDYLQFSANSKEDMCRSEQYTPVPPVKFYQRGYRGLLGERIYFGNPKSPKAFWVLSGSVLENMRSSLLDAEIIQKALTIGAKFTRIDLAVTEWNTFEGMVTVEDIETWVTKNLVSSSLLSGGAKTISSISPITDRVEETLYIGDMEKRGKKGIFRAYDKGIELDLGQYMATRLELEDRGKKAHNTALRIAETNDIAGNFRARFDVKHRDFDRLMDADAVATKRGKAQIGLEESEEIDRRWIWLMNQVAPSLKKAIRSDLKSGLGTDRLRQFLIKSGLGNKNIGAYFDKKQKTDYDYQE